MVTWIDLKLEKKKDFQDFAEIGRIQSYIIESTRKIAKKSAIDDVKRLLKAASKFKNNGIISKFPRSPFAYNIKMKKKNNISSKYITYCSGCKNHTYNMASRSVTMTNKVLRQKSKSILCLPDKSRFLKQDPSKKLSIEKR